MLTSSFLRRLLCAMLFALVPLTPTASFAAITLRFCIPDAACALPIDSPATATSGTIRGTVTAGGKPISGVNMRLVAPEYNIPVDATKTDAGGEYVFADVAPGMYKVATQMTGYQDRVCDEDVSQGITNVSDFNLAAPAPPEQVNIENVPVSPNLGCVEGYVLDVKPAPGQTTILCLVDGNKRICAVTEPDAQGKFMFPLMPPGDYRLEFQHPGYPARQDSVSVSAGLIRNRNYSPSNGWYFPFSLFGLFDPSSGGYVHLRGSDENLIGNNLLNQPDYETRAPAYGTAVLIR